MVKNKKIKISISIDERLLKLIDKITDADFSKNRSAYITSCIVEKVKRDGELFEYD